MLLEQGAPYAAVQAQAFHMPAYNELDAASTGLW
jgi:hypothetical protein